MPVAGDVAASHLLDGREICLSLSLDPTVQSSREETVDNRPEVCGEDAFRGHREAPWRLTSVRPSSGALKEDSFHKLGAPSASGRVLGRSALILGEERLRLHGGQA